MAWEKYVLSDHVHQASGMVAEQLGCTIAEALTRLRVEADARGRTLDDLALDVLDRILRFHDQPFTAVLEARTTMARWVSPRQSRSGPVPGRPDGLEAGGSET